MCVATIVFCLCVVMCSACVLSWNKFLLIWYWNCCTRLVLLFHPECSAELLLCNPFKLCNIHRYQQLPFDDSCTSILARKLSHSQLYLWLLHVSVPFRPEKGACCTGHAVIPLTSECGVVVGTPFNGHVVIVFYTFQRLMHRVNGSTGVHNWYLVNTAVPNLGEQKTHKRNKTNKRANVQIWRLG